jgi:hypothetical protein
VPEGYGKLRTLTGNEDGDTDRQNGKGTWAIPFTRIPDRNEIAFPNRAGLFGTDPEGDEATMVSRF